MVGYVGGVENDIGINLGKLDGIGLRKYFSHVIHDYCDLGKCDGQDVERLVVFRHELLVAPKLQRRGGPPGTMNCLPRRLVPA
jgi:hypothetical protein